MKRGLTVLMVALWFPTSLPAREAGPTGLREWVSGVRVGLQRAVVLAAQGDIGGARAEATRTYLDYYEVLEGWYGQGGAYAREPLATRITSGEAAFHAILRSSTAAELQRSARELEASLADLESLGVRLGVPLYPGAVVSTRRIESSPQLEFVSADLMPWQAGIAAAEAAHARGNFTEALRLVERFYLEGFEPLESRLPTGLAGAVERIIHLELRPGLRAQSRLPGTFAALRAELARADQFLAQGGSFWFGAANSLIIIVREGLEAVLLVGALLAYLTAAGATRRERRRIWLGAGAGIIASILTWVVARTIIPIGGASRELIEGITALIAVGVLLYVSHWLFQKTYIHDWKLYLRDHLGTALTRGSAFAMMGLAFAAVFREGFETVLFYQALLFDAGSRAVLAGFVPGVLIIAAVGWAVIRAGVKLPLKRVFAVTNTILLYLAFVFLGKGIFNLQESGAFAAHPIGWLPSHPLLQQLLGFYPLVETLAAQCALAVLLVLAGLAFRIQIAQRNAASQPTRAFAA